MQFAIVNIIHNEVKYLMGEGIDLYLTKCIFTVFPKFLPTFYRHCPSSIKETLFPNLMTTEKIINIAKSMFSTGIQHLK